MKIFMKIFKQIVKQIVKQKEIFFAIALAIFTQYALAGDAGGLGNANKLFENIAVALKGVSAIILTLAVMVAGYKIMWGGSTVREVAPFIIGGIILGSAAYIASLIAS